MADKTIVNRFSTSVVVRCRNEPEFEAIIKLRYTPRKGATPYIDCPHCGRHYRLSENGEWVADRPLVFV